MKKLTKAVIFLSSVLALATAPLQIKAATKISGYNTVYDFSKGLVTVEKDWKWGYIDKSRKQYWKLRFMFSEKSRLIMY